MISTIYDMSTILVADNRIPRCLLSLDQVVDERPVGCYSGVHRVRPAADVRSTRTNDPGTGPCVVLTDHEWTTAIAETHVGPLITSTELYRAIHCRASRRISLDLNDALL